MCMQILPEKQILFKKLQLSYIEKGATLFKMDRVKRAVKSKVVAKKWLDGTYMCTLLQA